MKPILCLLLAMLAGCAVIRPSDVVVDRVTTSSGETWVLYEGDWVYQMEGSK